MATNLQQQLEAIANYRDQRAIRPIWSYMYDRLSTCALASAGLVITGAAGTTAKVGATAFYASVFGTLVTKAAATSMPALSGTVANAKFNVFVFGIDNTGTMYSTMGTAGSTLATVGFPVTPRTQAIIGFVIVNPTGTGSFVGGTTALDDVTVVPNAVYVSPVGAFDPTAVY